MSIIQAAQLMDKVDRLRTCLESTRDALIGLAVLQSKINEAMVALVVEVDAALAGDGGPE